ncbi:MAG: TetR family transcriptional regulator, partial [Acidimicrobiaceae bacterium]|nr:TetR family transcriptional regulator [Acidimicrobiaceae bacterium]
MMREKVVTNRREVKKADTRRALLEAAGELFQTNGYQNTTVGQIADLADVSERTFFRYFESKEDLLLPDLVDFLDRIATQLELSPPTQQPIESLLESVKKVLAEGRGGGRSLLLQLPALSDSIPATR